ncbi:Os05g0561400 [Oryza sativa Japonica Group]|jgi:hypothetical protein|uniref:Os05g0561400 protein n=7 Tax=Oryza TaxID=4527 RepID=A0A0P0WQX8_ORYSJ|nr:hypothetical protein OsI_20970 [Oryza sativa Indica Group]EEE64680.1 hypothetical protein OsJ_19535 [Oryza sativa Japonica Group]KAF2932096.1 hypothetical protein DAI22_05g261600 [Oryza sativa Japonica Group]KAF2932097.1 hypothetical protein DAI22_05g261600 [Oryza sativa Japonica Group]BAF18227.1 Os05g0561400 [Oryza sativa Japonica Group]|eukprot:NP_001056313.1 Os05g0561400 [Oryza sativa Japonica Group]
MRPRVVQVWCLIVLAMIVVFAATPAMAARDGRRLHPPAPAARGGGAWNRVSVTAEIVGGGGKWEVPGGPDPQHHH